MPSLSAQEEKEPQKPFKNLQRLGGRCCKARVRKSERAEEVEGEEREGEDEEKEGELRGTSFLTKVGNMP